MPKLILSYLLMLVFVNTAFSQQEEKTAVFTRITNSLKDFKPDTSAAPNDKITRKIIQLRELRGGFNINEAIEFKMAEERENKERTEKEINALSDFFSTGNGKTWLNNAMIHIYRSHFNYPELKKMVRFYKTSAGQKMAADFPIIMLKSLKAGEMIRDIFIEKNKSK